ncbi:MAG TPA: DUF4382 domain-containing protein [Bacteroidia bacterium]|nr:DUF4382 domain-containing protein [Bacteroidia bacterium]
MKTNLKIISAAVITALCLTFTVSCKKSESTSTNAQSAPYNMYMTDSPGDYQAVNVNITGAMVYSAGVWSNLNVNAGIYNLLTLSNGKDTLLASGTIPTGVVTQIRLILGATGNTIVTGGVTYPLTTPSAQESGLKLDVNSVVTAGVTNTIKIDFDAGHSIVYTGNSTYMLKPVLRAVISANGSIKGTVSPATTETAVLAISAYSDSAFSYSNTLTGGFVIQGLAAGTYKVEVFPPSPFTVQTYTGITVSQGSITDMGSITISGGVIGAKQ